MRRIAAVLGVVLSVSAAPAWGFTTLPPKVLATLGWDGGGQLSAEGGQLIPLVPSPRPEPTWTWQICNQVAEACRPAGSGYRIEIGAPPAGTIFKATASSGVSALSALWNGPLRVVWPPSASGSPQAGELITARPARWEGGWTGDFSRTELSACPTSAGTGCIALTSSWDESGCPGAGAVIDPDFTGWYLRVASTVYGPDTMFAVPVTGRLYGEWPYGDAVPKAGPTTAVAMAGRIAPADGSPPLSCGVPRLVPGLPPRVAVNVRSAQFAPDGAAVVQCFADCTVDLHASRRGHFAVMHAKKQGEVRLLIPPRTLARLGRGPIRYTLFVDGHRVAQRTAGH